MLVVMARRAGSRAFTGVRNTERAGKGARNPKNKTSYRSLDRLAADPRILEIWDEGPDGLWADLARGFNNEGCSSLHEFTCAELIAAVQRIEKGDPY